MFAATRSAGDLLQILQRFATCFWLRFATRFAVELWRGKGRLTAASIRESPRTFAVKKRETPMKNAIRSRNIPRKNAPETEVKDEGWRRQNRIERYWHDGAYLF
jgi:hypothetical protein